MTQNCVTLCDNPVNVVTEDTDNDMTQSCVTLCDNPVDVVIQD